MNQASWEGHMARLNVIITVLMLMPILTGAVPPPREPRWSPGAAPAEPSYVQRVAPAIVALRVRADEAALSSARLGSHRFGSGIIFDARGYVVTVSYVLMDALHIEARLRDGRTVPARPAGLDLESGLGIVKLEGTGPWPVASLGRSDDAAVGTPTATVGVDEDDELVYVTGAVLGIRRFSSFWEYMLDRALFLAPASPAWGGSAVVDTGGAVIGIASLRLGEPPHVNLAIPIEMFLAAKDELIAAGRVVSRPPRPWLGLYTASTDGGVVVEDVAPVGPAARAGFRRGDHIVSVNGVAIGSQEEFYAELWRGRAGDVVRIGVRRDAALRVIAVSSVDRYRLLRPPAH
jgi:S1-C subfamily serine protease